MQNTKIKNTLDEEKVAMRSAALAETDRNIGPPAEKMPGHWLLARMGKRVLRPGGLELTKRLLDELAISPDDNVVEFAPGLGVTTRMALRRQPLSYTAVERDQNAARAVECVIRGESRRCVTGSAENTGLADASATIVYGEAMLSMQPDAAKVRITREAARILKSGGRYGIHELAMVPDGVPDEVREDIRRDLSQDIHVGVRPLTIREWRALLESAGLIVVAEETAPMHLLEPARLIRDEGLFRAIRFAWNIAWHPAARRRVLAMRRIFRKYAHHLAAVALVAEKHEVPKPSPEASPNMSLSSLTNGEDR